MADGIVCQSGIYAITNTVNGKKYIGSACCLKSRIRTHRSRLNLNKHHSIKLQNSWNKNGASSFEFSVIEYVEDKNCLINREQFWIDCFRSATSAGYNVSEKAGSCLGVKHSAETKAKVSAAGIGRKASAETIAKRVAATTGRKNTPEAIARMSGKPFSDERRAKISATKKGVKQTPQAIEKIRAASTGRRHTQESIAKMKLAKAGHRNTPESIAKQKATKAAKKAAANLAKYYA